MQVACNSCGAQYEFDASAIPAEGYDAQCTSCSAIFFVSPEPGQAASGPPVDDDAPQVSVSCSHCGAVYQFAASDIPTGGYDAQCTQCQGVFFVSPEAVSPTAYKSEFVEALTQPAMVYSSYTNSLTSTTEMTPQAQTAEFTPALPPENPGFSPRPLDAGTMEMVVPVTEENFAEADPIEVEPELVEVDPDSGVHADPAAAPPAQGFADADVGKPVRNWTTSSHAAQAAADIDQEDDPGTKGRYKPLLMGIAAIALIGIVGSVGVKMGPQWVQRFKQPAPKVISPQAQAAFERGKKAMLEDTDENYQAANAAFLEATNMAPDYAEAWAWAAVAHMFQGEDRLAAGRVAYKAAQTAHAEARVFASSAPQGRVKPRELADFTAHLQALQHAAQAGQQKALELFENGGKSLSDGAVLLLKAQRAAGDRALIAEAEAIWYTSGPAGAAAAAQELASAASLRADPEQKQAQAADPMPWWETIAQARLEAAETATQSKAVATLRGITSTTPQVVRARWELAELFARTAQKNEARDVAQTILATVPTHAKAQALLASLSAPAEKAPVVAAAEPAAPAPAKPGKAKRHPPAHARKH